MSHSTSYNSAKVRMLWARRAREACRKVRISDAGEIEGMFILLQIHTLLLREKIAVAATAAGGGADDHCQHVNHSSMVKTEKGRDASAIESKLQHC